MSLFIWEKVSFLIGAPVTPVVRRDVIRAPVPAVPLVGTTVVAFVAPDHKTFVVPSDPKPGVVR